MPAARRLLLVHALVSTVCLAPGCSTAPTPTPTAQRPSWMPPEKPCPPDALMHMQKMGLKVGDRIPVVVDEIQNRPGSARYKSGFVTALPQVNEGELRHVSIGGYLYVANHRVFGRYDRAYVRYFEGDSLRDFYQVPFCGVLLDPRWDRDGEGLISYPGPERGTAVVQDSSGVILVVDRFP